IKFFNNGDPYYEFTNFYEACFNLDGLYWKTSEHYYQAQKFSPNKAIMEQVRHLPNPREAFKFGNFKGHKHFIRKDWHDIKEEIMEKAIRAKFEQNSKLQNLLFKTKGSELIENSPFDDYWGIGINNNGQNRLGVILMKVRDSL
ncbi:hypothetical protein DICPUDRAFT_22458, partial [Dictyostelium purpureum]